MKNFKCLIILLLLSFGVNATIYRLNYPGTPIAGKDFTGPNFNLLHNAASAGDTVQFYANNSNDSVVCSLSKSLKIIGFGFNLNVNSGLQNVSYLDSTSNSINIYFGQGSAGSIIEGVTLTDCIIADSNITIRRCKIDGKGKYGNIEIGSTIQSLNNITINGCYIRKNYDTAVAYNSPNNDDYSIYVWQDVPFTSSTAYSINNLKITNNIIEGSIYMNSNAGSNGLIANNVIIQKQGISWALNALLDLQFDDGSYFIKNNILYYDSTKYFNTIGAHLWPIKLRINSNSIFANNISNMPVMLNQGVASNIFGVNSNLIFTTGFNKGWFTSEASLQLAATSPAISAGKNNMGTTTNCGVFGGEDGEVFKLSGLPSVPSIFMYTAPATSNTNPTNINISTRTNN